MFVGIKNEILALLKSRNKIFLKYLYEVHTKINTIKHKKHENINRINLP